MLTYIYTEIDNPKHQMHLLCQPQPMNSCTCAQAGQQHQCDLCLLLASQVLSHTAGNTAKDRTKSESVYRGKCKYPHLLSAHSQQQWSWNTLYTLTDYRTEQFRIRYIVQQWLVYCLQREYQTSVYIHAYYIQMSPCHYKNIVWYNNCPAKCVHATVHKSICGHMWSSAFDVHHVVQCC